VVSIKSVWTFADITNGLMAIPNLISLIVLSGVLVAETRETDPAVQARLATEVKRLVGTRCQVSPEVVHLVPPQVVPKTPSGKIRRAACREMYLQDALNASKTPVWLQVARLLAGNTLAQLKKRIS